MAPLTPIAQMLVGLGIAALGAIVLMWPDEVGRGNRVLWESDRRIARAWNWWVRTGLPLFMGVVMGLALFADGLIRSL